MFSRDYFQKKFFTDQQIRKYLENANRDFEIAQANKVNEIIFTFSYNAFLKLGITLIAFKGYKVKSRQGHHIQIILQMAKIMEDEKIEIIGEAMRRKRNMDLYTGGTLVSKKETKEFLEFTKNLMKRIQLKIFSEK